MSVPKVLMFVIVSMVLKFKLYLLFSGFSAFPLCLLLWVSASPVLKYQVKYEMKGIAGQLSLFFWTIVTIFPDKCPNRHKTIGAGLVKVKR